MPGLEYAGTIAEVGADAVGPLGRRWQAGERVMGLLGGGAYSSLLLAPEVIISGSNEASANCRRSRPTSRG